MFFDLLVTNALPYKFYYFSPVSLSRLDVVDAVSLTSFPSLSYAFIFFSVSIICMSAIIAFMAKYISILIENTRE